MSESVPPARAGEPPVFDDAFRARFAEHPLVGEVRGVSHSDGAAPLVYLRSSFHVPHQIRGTVTVGDRDSRHLSWSDFS